RTAAPARAPTGIHYSSPLHSSLFALHSSLLAAPTRAPTGIHYSSPLHSSLFTLHSSLLPLIILAPSKIIRQARHILGFSRLEIMSILVALSVSHVPHQRGRRIPQVQRDRLALRLERILLSCEVGLEHRV